MLNREAIALSICLEDHAARYFAHGARPSGVLETQRALSQDARNVLREGFQARHSGQNSGDVVVLEEGMKFTTTAFNSVNFQFHEMRKFQFQEIARIYGIPSVLLQDDKATATNTEALGRQYITFTLRPWLESWRQRDFA